MSGNNIIFADLSTYTPASTMSFYTTVFGWEYHEENQYYLAFSGNQETTGLYETPEKFKQMRMPHFWMTYIQVDDAAKTVAKAKELGGIIEVSYTLPNFGNVALIRDPKGAGFTIYEGSNLKNTRTESQSNTLIWNELHISDSTAIVPFYEQLFDWKFSKVEPGYFQIFNQHENHVADALEISNADKGKFEYWVCTFGVSDLPKSVDLVVKNGGTVITEETNRILVTDNSKQAFFYLQSIH